MRFGKVENGIVEKGPIGPPVGGVYEKSPGGTGISGACIFLEDSLDVFLNCPWKTIDRLEVRHKLTELIQAPQAVSCFTQ